MSFFSNHPPHPHPLLRKSNFCKYEHISQKLSFLLASNPKLILNFSGEQLQQYFPVCPFHWPDSIWTSWTSDSSVLKLRSENKTVGASFLEWWVCLLVFILSLSANIPLRIGHDTYCQWSYVGWKENPNISYVLSIWGNLKLMLGEGVQKHGYFMDEFSEKFQTAFDPLSFSENYIAIFYDSYGCINARRYDSQIE